MSNKVQWGGKNFLLFNKKYLDSYIRLNRMITNEQGLRQILAKPLSQSTCISPVCCDVFKQPVETVLWFIYLPNRIFPFGYNAFSPSISSIRISWLYLAIRSVREAEPVLICPQLRATARSAMVVSSVSPLR